VVNIIDLGSRSNLDGKTKNIGLVRENRKRIIIKIIIFRGKSE